jgi:hypothetical protein
MTDIVLPGFGMGMTDGTIIAWHKAVGDPVRQGEPICDVEAAKTTVEVEATRDGYIQQILVAAGANVPVRTVIAVIGDTAVTAGELVPEPEVAPAPLTPPPPPPTPQTPSSKRRQVEPRARKAARLHGIEIEAVAGSGPGGRVVEADVLLTVRSSSPGSLGVVTAKPAAPAAPAPAVSAASAGAIHQLRMRCDGSALAALLSELAQIEGPAVRLDAVLARAAALALAQTGIARPAIAMRAADGTLGAVPDPLANSVRALIAGLAFDLGSLPESGALVIEAPCDDWLEECIRIDPACPASLAVGSRVARDWPITLIVTDKWHGIDTASQFLRALRELLQNPLAIIA